MQNHVDKSLIHDRLMVMRLQEESDYRCYDYLFCDKNCLELNRKFMIQNRSKMCDWCYKISDSCGFQRETAAQAMSYLDRYLCTNKGNEALSNGKIFQLAATTAFYIAVKVRETVLMDANVLVTLGQGSFSKIELENMERNMLNELNWRVNGPTPHTFLECFFGLLPTSIDQSIANEIASNARHQADLAIRDYSFVGCLSSQVAVAATLNAVSHVDGLYFPSKDKSQFIDSIKRLSGMFLNDVVIVQANLHQLQLPSRSINKMKIITDIEKSSCDKSPVSVARNQIA